MAGCRVRRYGASWTERATRGRDEVSSGGETDSYGVDFGADVVNDGGGGGEDDKGQRVGCMARRWELQWRARIVLCMNVRATTASGPANSMHRGSWSRDDDGSDVHDTADWIESWRRASGLKPNPRCGQVLARTLSQDLSGAARSL